MSQESKPRAGHGDHWLAALEPDDPRLQDVLAVPTDAPQGLKLHRSRLNEAVDLVQVTRDRGLVTAYPEPRATTLFEGNPRELVVWDTRAEGWLTLDHPILGAVTLFLTDLPTSAPRYAAAGRTSGLTLEVAGLAYALAPATADPGPVRLGKANKQDPRFLPDDYEFHAEIVAIHPAGDGEVLDLRLQGDVVLPVAWRHRSELSPGDRVSGYLWLTGRIPEGRHG